MSKMRSRREISDRLAAARLRARALWLGDDRRFRVGHSGDVVTMLDDLLVPTIGEMVTLNRSEGRR